MSTGTGVNVSKAVAYAVLLNPPGVNVTKANVYTVFGNSPGSTGVNVSKANLYAVFSISNFNIPIWPNFTFANGTVGNLYSQQWDLTPASPPTTYSVISGSLPTGLALTSPSDDLGLLSGTPTVAGSYSFTLKASNAFGTSNKTFTLLIVPASGGSFGFMV